MIALRRTDRTYATDTGHSTIAYSRTGLLCIVCKTRCPMSFQHKLGKDVAGIRTRVDDLLEGLKSPLRPPKHWISPPPHVADLSLRGRSNEPRFERLRLLVSLGPTILHRAATCALMEVSNH